MYRIVCIGLMLTCLKISAQPNHYTLANAHAHNDYEKEFPFWNAYSHGFGSMEADIYLVNDQLYVAHDTLQLKLHKTLDSLYLQPIQHCIRKNNGFIYTDHKKELQLLIDIKTDAEQTLSKLLQKLKEYPSIITNGTIKIVISGNRPIPSKFSAYPPYILFDGELNKDYSAEELKRIVMMSDNFKRYSLWNGDGNLPDEQRTKILEAISKSHRLKKKVRFWNAPDSNNAWDELIKMDVDFINTDKVSALAMYLNKKN